MGYTVIMSGELYHHGIKGQKWGVRRYQNEDGSLTNAGRKRYGADLDINDKTRTNVAKIRLGEARRSYDAARSDKSTTLRALDKSKRDVKIAKKNLKNAKYYDQGAKLAEKGKTTKKLEKKAAVAVTTTVLATYLTSKAVKHFTDKKMTKLLINFNTSKTAYKTAMQNADKIARNISRAELATAAAYIAHLNVQNKKLQTYSDAAENNK